MLEGGFCIFDYLTDIFFFFTAGMGPMVPRPLPPGSHRWIRQRLIMRDGTYGPAFEVSDAEYNSALMPSGVLVPDGNDVQVNGAAFEETIIEETMPE